MKGIPWLAVFVCAISAGCSNAPSPTTYMSPGNRTAVAGSAVIRYQLNQIGSPNGLIQEKVIWSVSMLGKAQSPSFVGASWVHVGAADSAQIDVTPIGATPPGQPFIITASVANHPDYKSELIITSK